MFLNPNAYLLKNLSKQEKQPSNLISERSDKCVREFVRSIKFEWRAFWRKEEKMEGMSDWVI